MDMMFYRYVIELVLKIRFVFRSNLKRVGFVALGVSGSFLLVNLIIFVAFHQRTYPNTALAGHTIGSVKYDKLPQKIDSLNIVPKKIQLIVRNHSMITPVSNLGVNIDTTKILNKVEIHSWLPVLNLFTSHNAHIYTKINHSTFSNAVGQITATNKQDPINSSIAVKDNHFVLLPAISGYRLDTIQTVDVINQAIASDKDSAYLPTVNISPSISEKDTQPILSKLQAQLTVKLEFSYANQSVSPSQVEVINWYVPNSNTFKLNDSAIEAYVIQIGSSNHINVQNITQAVTAVKIALTTFKTLQFTLIPVPPGPCQNNSGNQLILVSITQQHMWACEGSNLVNDSPISSGAYQLGYITPTGTWYVYGKSANINLIGPSWNDFVQYWLPFKSDYGFHDSSWQTFPYGSPDYATQGSHGCIHVPLTTMSWLYNWSSTGTTVTIQP